MAVTHDPSSPSPRIENGVIYTADPADSSHGELFAGGGELGARMQAIDWSQTPLGPVERWPQSLKTCLRIVLTSRQPMFVWWGDSLINLYNDAYKSILGGKHPEALGQPASVVWREIWDQVEPRAAKAMRENTGTYDEALLLLMERNGYPEETYYTFSYSPVPNDQGGTGGILCANTDDTARIIDERQLLLLRELAARTACARSLGDTLRLAAEALATNPRDLPFAAIYLSGGVAATIDLAETVGIARGHALVPKAIALDDGDPLGAGDLLHAAIREVLDRHEPAVIDLPAASAPPSGAWPQPPARMALLPIAQAGHHGRTGVLAVGLNPYRLFDEAYRGFLGLVAGQIAGNIANAQAYEGERRRAEALAEIDRAKTVFFSNVSHELRTPLTLILGPQEDALRSPDEALTGDVLRAVHRNTLRLLKLVNTLLDFSRIEAGRVQASYRPTDLAALTRDLASTFRAAIERGGLRFEVDCPPLPASIYVDAEMWEKIVLNLLSNAFKFTFEGAIRVALRLAADRVELIVADTGAGIPPEELPRLFERFHRVEGARSRTYEGSGIGLALVHDLVKLHGGAVRVASELGKGTTFTISIPTGIAHLPAERIDAASTLSSTGLGADAYVAEALRWVPGADPAPAPAPAAARVPAPGLAPPTAALVGTARVLVVDDNADLREYVGRLLRQQGWTVQAVADGAEALAAVRAARPDLLLTDVMMPNLDGFGLLRALREDAATRSIPVIMLSARAGEESRVEGLVAGADDYLVKPFSAQELVARVATHLQLARMRHEAEADGERLYELLMQAPMAVAVMKGPRFVFELANQSYLQVVQRADLIGKPFAEVFPELVGTPLAAAVERVYRTGEAFVTDEYALTLQRGGKLEQAVFKFSFVPTRDGTAITGVVLGAIEITEQIKARRAIEASEARFRRIFESSMIGFLFSRTDGTVLEANDYFLRLLGVTREDVREGRVRWTDRTAPGYEAQTEEALRQLRETGTSTPFEKEYIDAAGRRVPVVVGSTLLPGIGDEIVTFVLDIGERKRVEQQLGLLAEASRVIASSHDTAQTLQGVARLCSPILGDWCGVYLLDDTGAFTVAGSHHVDPAKHAIARAAMTRFRPAPDLGYGVAHVVKTGEPQLLRDVTALMRRHASADPGKAALLERLGLRSAILVPLATADRTFGAICFGVSESARRFDEQDLVLAEELGRRISQALETERLHTERGELLASERHARGEAESASRAKDEFLALLGHELRNPLAPIVTALQLMQLRGAHVVERERAVIERQTQHLVRLVDDLLDVSRITRGKVELKRERTELAPVVTRAIEMASPLIEQRRHDLEVQVPPRGLALDADPARLAQVIANLLTNAAKYTESGGRITITAARIGAEIELAVRDTGIGIAPDVLPRVFDMFVQERQALDRAQGGLGLGLTIVRSLVDLHGGTVSVHSDGQGQGSEFSIRLPAAVPLVAAGAAARAAPADAAPGGLRILIVDDNADAAELLAGLLEAMGHATKIAHDGPAALLAAGPFAPELALLDIGLPVMDGYELAQRLRQQLADPGLRIVAVTGYGLDSDRERTRAAGFDAHLVKPVSYDRLRRIIAELCPEAARAAPA
jgi:PAS domain S-box-containing protein